MTALYNALLNSTRGLVFAVRSERAVRQELLVLVLSGPASFAVSEHAGTRIALVGVIVLTLAIELLNTAIEKLCDHVSPGLHPQIGAVKDMGSAAVLCSMVLTGSLWGAVFVWEL